MQHHSRHLTAIAAATLMLFAAAGAPAAGAPAAETQGGITVQQQSAIASTFGVTEDATTLRIDSGAGLVVKMTKARGDITSIQLNGGPELQSSRNASHINSGFTAQVAYAVENDVIRISMTVATHIHYILVRRNENTLYMGTYVITEPSPGELRWITRLKGTVFTGVPAGSNLVGNTGAIESSDVFGMADGTTRSKYYGNQRAIDLTLRGVHGDGVAAWMIYGNRETSSGGPFFRDIQNQSGTDTEVYNYMNSGHAQTEANRMGFNGPYALAFTDGEEPAIPDMRWMGEHNLAGWVGPAGRGQASGAGFTGLAAGVPYVVGLANAAAQYWNKVNEDGTWTIPAAKAGTYTLTLYRNELAVYTEEVTIQAGDTTALPVRAVTDDPNATPAFWRIGTWDGTPLELQNGNLLPFMHPSDVRMTPWLPATYTIGTSLPSAFPAAQFKVDVNNPTTVKFHLRAAQIQNRKIRIGITAAGAGGRPNITVNGWSSTAQAASSQPSSRIVTFGTWRGRNKTYTFDVPASAFVTGTNTLVISIVSGSAGSEYLGPYSVYDALDML